MHRKRTKPIAVEVHANGHSPALAALPPTAADDELLLIDHPVAAPPPLTRPRRHGRDGDGEPMARREP